MNCRGLSKYSFTNSFEEKHITLFGDNKEIKLEVERSSIGGKDVQMIEKWRSSNAKSWVGRSPL